MTEPTIKKYAAGLLKMKKPSPRFIEMLHAHYHSTNRTSTARELARQAGYKNYRGFNIRYGIFARELGKAMGLKASLRIGLLVEFASPGDLSNKEYLVFMRERFAKALHRVGWV
jgi:hypothetical protein